MVAFVALLLVVMMIVIVFAVAVEIAAAVVGFLAFFVEHNYCMYDYYMVVLVMQIFAMYGGFKVY